jgi:hypothetical protein
VVSGGVVVGLSLPNGLNCEMKFVPELSSPGVVTLRCEYKNPNTTITMMIKIIVKSTKFLFDIKLIKSYMIY